MHYAFGRYGFPVIAGVEPFLQLYSNKPLDRIADNFIEFTPGTPSEIIILSFQNSEKSVS
jgi:hypothetical protein